MNAYREPGRLPRKVDEGKEAEVFALALQNGTQPVALWVVILLGLLCVGPVVASILTRQPYFFLGLYPSGYFIGVLAQRRAIARLRKLEAEAGVKSRVEQNEEGFDGDPRRRIRFVVEELDDVLEEPVSRGARRRRP